MKFRYLLIVFVLLLTGKSIAQTTDQFPPKSFATTFQIDQSQLKRVPQPNLFAVRQTDQQNPSNRFAYPVKVDLSFEDGVWYELPAGGRIWQLELQSPEALGLAVFYDEFYLPPGATLHMYTPDRREVIGAYTSRVNPKNGKFLTGFTKGDKATLEYFEPESQSGQGRLHIFRVDYAYQKDNFDAALRSVSQDELGFGASDGCSDNINCTQGQDFQTEKKGICRILIVVDEGTGFCTGNLINNTREDNTPYLLSAFHCQDGFTPLHDFWRFDFNYESGDCSDPTVEPAFQSILGCVQRAGRQANDLLLLELNQEIPSNFDAYFLGWDRSMTSPSDVTMVHHPKGDIKKISTTDQTIRVFNGLINWSNEVSTPAQHHFEVRWTDGGFEVGSSGAALLDQNKRIVGQLHGGNNVCDDSQAWAGRLALAWEGGGTADTRLRDWLDPDGKGVLQLNGRPNTNTAGVTVAGMVLTDGGDPIPNVQILLLGAKGLAMAVFTDAMGAYAFTNVPVDDVYQISPNKTGAANNGLSVLDLIQVRKHILNIDQLASPYQILAADVNASNSVSTLDLILMQKVILNIDVAFENIATWTFLPADAVFVDNADPFQGLSSGNFGFQLAPDHMTEVTFDLIGIKTGDVNNSADLE